MTGRTPRVVVTSRSFGHHAPDGLRVLEGAGCEVVLAGKGAPWPEDRLAELARDAEALIVGTDRVTRPVLAAASRLRVVAKYGVGVDNVDLAAAADRGITVTNAPGASADSVAELTIGLLFALWRGLVRADAAMRAGRWGPVVGREIRGRTLGIVGLGRIGKAVARMARALGMEVLAFDVVRDPAFAAEIGLTYGPLEEVLRAADAVSIHVPLTAQTHHFIGARELSWLHSEAILVNVARGGVVDEEALARALEGGRLAGAAVDVFAEEPPWGSPLLRAPNVLLTPHIGAHTREAIVRVDRMVAADVVAVLHGQPPVHPVHSAS